MAVESAILKYETFREMVTAIFTRLGADRPDAEIVTDVLAEASLSGYDSHGVMRVPVYVADIRAGRAKPGEKSEIVRESDGSALLDGKWALGPVTASRAVRIAVEKARHAGIGCVSVKNSHDIARLGSYLIRPAGEGFVTLMMVNDAGAGPSVVPWGSVEPLLSTNPIAAGIPRRGKDPILIDVSTGITSVGKLRMAANRGEEVPEGWLIDRTGKFSTDPNTFFERPRRSGLLPLGGLLAGHKGFALSLLVDILAGGLGGAGCSAGDPGSGKNGLFVLAIDPAHFDDPERFVGRVEDLVLRIKNLKKGDRVEEIMISGERSARERRRRMKEGIPIDPPTWEKIRNILEELEISLPD